MRCNRCTFVLLAMFLMVCTRAVAVDKPGPLPVQTESIKTLYSVPVKFDMVKIPAGKFMYSPDSKTPPKETEIKSFWIGKSECLWDHYDVYESRLDLTEDQKIEMKKTGVDAKTRPSKPYLAPDRGYGHTGFPVISVSYKSATMYCVWLSEKTGKKYRLPTEAEWEYACRAGAKDPVQLAKNQVLDMAWTKENADDKTQPAMTKKPNAWGLYDMLGNAGEWCSQLQGDLPVLKGATFLEPATKINPGWRAPFDKAWQETDPNIPKATWWLSDGTFTGFRIARDD
ncbi:MAG TPA: SUMF1/EgtB/PvdO family nonheme iron enzyme [Tepidisphaeraceae bacterium]|nr:SUMF1/EgtB/PvdO family nonheme iron enzyme [Tepidisphaeraceae bacterium]